jgi:hypothetical protein
LWILSGNEVFCDGCLFQIKANAECQPKFWKSLQPHRNPAETVFTLILNAISFVVALFYLLCSSF